MEPTNPQPPMLAKGPDSAASVARTPAGRTQDLALPSDPEVAAERIRGLLAKDLYLNARELAAAAVRRFPDHPALQKLWRIFDNRSKSWVVPGETEPDTDEEFEWLRQPPEWAHGKWVALVGSEAVAVGETLHEVTKSLRLRKFPKRPLVHRID